MCNFSIKYNVYNSLCPLAKILMILRALAICSGVKCNITSIPMFGGFKLKAEKDRVEY